jgi:putative membrane protein
MTQSLLIAGIVIASIIWYVQYRIRRRARALSAARENSGLEVLTRRYARGEIDRNEYLQKRDDILDYLGSSPGRG